MVRSIIEDNVIASCRHNYYQKMVYNILGP
jgi:hypothetical protein